MKHNFKESYDVLQRHAATLRHQSEPNIDDLLRIVEESVAAYKTCQARIDAVEKALDKALSQLEPGGEDTAPADQASPASNAKAGKPAKAAKTTVAKGPNTQPPEASDVRGFDDMDDDIPF